MLNKEAWTAVARRLWKSFWHDAFQLSPVTSFVDAFHAVLDRQEQERMEENDRALKRVLADFLGAPAFRISATLDV